MNYDAGGVVVVPLDWAPHTRFAEAKLSLKDTGLMCLGERGRPKLTVYRLIISTYETRGVRLCSGTSFKVSAIPCGLLAHSTCAAAPQRQATANIHVLICGEI